MDGYKKVYFFLFNKISDAILALEQQNYGQARKLLMDGQAQAEELCLEIASEEDEVEA